jgi:hypothetical protein
MSHAFEPVESVAVHGAGPATAATHPLVRGNQKTTPSPDETRVRVQITVARTRRELDYP